MVALRDISTGEEICITYIPNGDWDGEGTSTSDRFQHFEPTRTWKWLNRHTTDDGLESELEEDISDDEDDDENNEDLVDEGHDKEDKNDAKDDQSSSIQEKEDPPEGSDEPDRAKALLEYGFKCQCHRCRHERAKPETPYHRENSRVINNKEV
jgi:hypothetical protein